MHLESNGEQFSLLKLVERVAFDLKEIATHKQISIMPFVAPEIPQVYHGNEQQIYKVLHMATEFAINYSDGEVVINAEPANLAQPLETALEIKFEVSFVGWLSSLDPANTLRPHVEELGTHLIFTNNPAHRSQFMFCMHLRVADLRAPVPMLPDEMKGKSLFLVSNEPAANRAIQNYLRWAGMQCDGAPTGREALIEIGRRAAINEPYDSLLIAEPISDLPAFTFARIVRESSMADCPIIIVDQFENEMNRLLSEKSGFNKYLSKPFSQDELFKAVQDILAGGAPTLHEKAFVLIVEDNPINQKTLLFQLRHLGYDGDVVATGRAALDVIDGPRKYSMVMLDLELPDAAGEEIAEAMRARGVKVPILAVTARNPAERKTKAAKAGMNDYLFKPVMLKDVQSALKRWVDKPHLRRTS